MVEVPQKLLDFIREGTCFAVVGHEEPDGDCAGSQLALASLLKRMGKKAIPCSAGPFERTELRQYEKHFLPFPGERDGLKVIVMDVSVRERVGDLPIDGLPTAVIDHHISSDPWGEVMYVDPSAPSVTFLIEKIFQSLGYAPTREEAEFLLFGLLTDTGFFRHLDEKGAETFITASRLVSAGASPKKLFGIISGGKPLASRLLLGASLSRIRAYYGGKLLITDETLDELNLYGHDSRDSDLLYQLLQSIEGGEAIVLIREESEEECSLGFRSRDRVNVGAIAECFGGGGHFHASGAKSPGTIPELEEKIVAAFKKWFQPG